ncbi:unnamed protein product [Polarella glacialis]|uniref:GMP phosphodiesterase delta subunit domain-containing protein n=1 Tax=Polarella glacialis TaxID=89957 RepID=A0A813IQ04_POLGL|nr:unnamed protein product [Polarella glacialis]
MAEYAEEQEGLVQITPEYVQSLTGPTDGFLCNISDNIYAINFVAFKIRQVNEGSEVILFEVTSPEGAEAPPPAVDGDDSSRFIRYHFGPEFLDIPTVGTTLEFTIGDQPVHNFRMIEKHYFRDQLLIDYDFATPFVIPNTRNTWEMIYTKPELTQAFSCAWACDACILSLDFGCRKLRARHGSREQGFQGFLCNISDNIYNINFVAFKIRQVNEGSEVVLFEVTSPEGAEAPPPAVDGDDSSRFIRYHFGPEFLDIPTVGTTLEFTIGDQPVHNFRMIEKHYFRDQLLIDYDFSVPFVIPNTRSTWEMIYTKPELTQEQGLLFSCFWAV